MDLLDGMQIFVRMPYGKTISLRVWKSDTIHNLKVQICAMEDIDVPHQMLHYGGKELLDKLTVGDYNIHQEATLQLSGRLQGGIQNFFNTLLLFPF